MACCEMQLARSLIVETKRISGEVHSVTHGIRHSHPVVVMKLLNYLYASC